MNRRSFVGLSGGALIGSALIGLDQLIPATDAIAAAAIVLIVQTAISVASLFLEGDGGIGSLLRLQVEMLKQISAKLDVIQKGIQEILLRLEELRQLIGDVPQAVVIELNRANIAGLSGRYIEIMKTYKADLDIGGIDAAQRQSQKELNEQLLAPLQSARDVLMGYSNFSLVPTICSACFIETHALIMANTRKTRMLEAIRRYKSWLTAISQGTMENTLEGKIASLQKVQDQETKTAKGSGITYDCNTLYSASQAFGCPEYRHYGGEVYVHCLGIQSTPTIIPVDTPEIAKAVGEMLKAGILTPNEEPTQLVFTFAATTAERAGFHCIDNNYPPHHGKYTAPNQCAQNAYSESCSQAEQKHKAEAVEASTRLTSNGLQLMSLHALKYSADSGLAFLMKLESSVTTIPGSTIK